MKQRNFGRRVWTVVFLGVAGMLCASSLAGAAASIPTVGVLTPGLTFGPVVEGLREGLEKLGYKEEQNIRVMIEDSQGDLFAYGTDLRLIGVQAARLVVKILKGEKPSDVPIETPEKFLLAVNLTVAKAIGLKIPRAVLERVDRVVE